MSHSEDTHSHLEHPQGISAYYGELVFGPKAQKGYLSAEAIAEIHKAVNDGHTVHRDAADEIAGGMKRWALDMGGSHCLQNRPVPCRLVSFLPLLSPLLECVLLWSI